MRGSENPYLKKKRQQAGALRNEEVKGCNGLNSGSQPSTISSSTVSLASTPGHGADQAIGQDHSIADSSRHLREERVQRRVFFSLGLTFYIILDYATVDHVPSRVIIISS